MQGLENDFIHELEGDYEEDDSNAPPQQAQTEAVAHNHRVFGLETVHEVSGRDRRCLEGRSRGGEGRLQGRVQTEAVAHNHRVFGLETVHEVSGGGGIADRGAVKGYAGC